MCSLGVLFLGRCILTGLAGRARLLPLGDGGHDEKTALFGAVTGISARIVRRHRISAETAVEMGTKI
jgi:hypothetical protein